MTARPRLTGLDVALYGGVTFAWGFTWLAQHYQVGMVAPEVSVLWRFVIAAPFMLLIAAIRGEQLRFPLRDHLWFAVLGITLFCTNFALFYYAAKSVTSGLLAVVFSLASIINVWLGALLFGTPVNRRTVIGGLLGVAGLMAMFYPQFAGTDLNRDMLIGLALSVAGTFSFCFGNMISAHLQRRPLPIFAMTGFGMIYGAAFLALFAAFRGQAFIIEPTARYVISLLYLALIGSVMAFTCYLTLLGRIGADRAAYATVMFPVVALAVSTVFEGYRWTIPAAFGLLAVIAGIVLALRAPKKS
jgi:drug/metabolite transporter (DMT)-like permease